MSRLRTQALRFIAAQALVIAVLLCSAAAVGYQNSSGGPIDVLE
jgi:hypothetical protein